MQRSKLQLPHKDMGEVAEKLENQLHGIQRTSTKMGLHTRYSGKEQTGMDDMAWSLALAVYKEFEFNFEPMIVQVKDETLARLQKQSERPEMDVAMVW